MNTNVIQFPEIEQQASTNPFMAMSLTKIVNGKTVIMNVAKMTKDEFLMALIFDDAILEKQELARKYINS